MNNGNPYQKEGHVFGRETDTKILADKIITHRLTLLFSPHAMGKTVFLQDALIPWLTSPLQKNLDVIYYRDWQIEPQRELKAVIEKTLNESGVWPDGVEKTIDPSLNLSSFLEFCTLFTRHPLIIILDQFEELFRHRNPIPAQTIKSFVEQLITVITTSDLPVKLLLSMQEDATLELQTFARELNKVKHNLPLLLFDNYYRLRGITRQAAKETIIVPAEELGFHYETGLPDQMISDLLTLFPPQSIGIPPPQTDANTAIVEPAHLQIFCAQLWQLEADNPDKTLRLSTYTSTGGIKGLLKTHIITVLDSLPTKDKRIISQAFGYLISRRGLRISHTPQGLAELLNIEENELHSAFNELTRQQIIRYRQFGDESWYSLYHDVLIDSIQAWNQTWQSTRTTDPQTLERA